MKKLIINHWYDLNALIAVLMVILIITQKGSFDFQQRVILFEFAFMNAHLFEEYGHSGTMPGTLNVALYHNRQAPLVYPFNQLSAIICNYLFMIILWLLPAFEPEWNWAILGAIFWGFIEFLLHLVYYPHKTHSTMSGGILTALMGFLPCGIIYMAFAINAGKISIISATVGLIYPIILYMIIFRWLGAKVLATPAPKYPFTVNQIARYVKNIKEHPTTHHKVGAL